MDTGQSSASGIALPKGGGAISGIGETFTADPFTGAAGFSVPIYTSMSREGFRPTLALEYSSGYGNGVFGMGWRLSVPRVSRKTARGVPSYAGEDTFLLSGAEDLVPVEDAGGAPVDVSNADFLVTRYRPRTEGLFARIERWESRTTGLVHWRSTDQSNVTNVYGKNPGARLSDPSAPDHVAEWLLEETFDRKGNHIAYEYVREETALPAHVASERGRTQCQLYLRRILYGATPDDLPNASARGPRWTGTDHLDPLGSRARHYLFEVLLDYGDLDPAPAIPFDRSAFLQSSSPTDWPLRPDPFSSFRTGFEVRTLRRCERVLMLHHFADGELDGAPIVKSTEFTYEVDGSTRHSFLSSVTVTGSRKSPNDPTRYLSRSFPPLTFRYSAYAPETQRFQVVASTAGDVPSTPLSDPDTALVDLQGDGLVDVLTTTESHYYYWENQGEGRLDRRHVQHSKPASAVLSSPRVRLGDQVGNGLADLIVEEPAGTGYYEASWAADWRSFQRFDRAPTVDLADPNLRLVDLTGDGRSDILVTRDHHFLWYRNLGSDGYAAPDYVERVRDLETFPDVYFAEPTGRVRLADMTGDGLVDIVLLHDGRIDYWPSLGFGRFGTRRTLAETPRLGRDFDPRRLFLVDLNGSGCSDLVHVGLRHVEFWFNQSGNGWSTRERIDGTPLTLDPADVQFRDVLGSGTMAAIWSDPVGSATPRYMFLDFCGGHKPHLLEEMDNNLGVVTRVRYAPSTKFYLADKRAGRRWVSTIPFPVQVVERTETTDRVNRSRLVTTFTYHHGYYDGAREREFRGFGRVDQFDTETFDALVESDDPNEPTENITRSTHSPRVLTRRWFHTGIYFDGDRPAANGEFYDATDMMEAYRSEFDSSDPQAFVLDPHDLEAGDRPHEAYRALRGSLLRSETHVLDDDDASTLFATVDTRYRVRQLQDSRSSVHGVFHAHPLEAVSYHYEGRPQDPRVAHEITMRVDDFGHVTDLINIAYPRRPSAARRPEQDRLYVAYTHSRHIDTRHDLAVFYAGVRSEVRQYEISGITWGWGSPRLTLPHFVSVTADPDAYRPFHWLPSPAGGAEKRILRWTRSYFRTDANPAVLDAVDDVTHRLALHAIESLALPYETYQASLTNDLIDLIYENRLPQPGRSSVLEGAGYVWADGLWWIPSGRQSFDPARFYLPTRAQDPFGNVSGAAQDDYALMAVTSVDAEGNETRADNCYRTLHPCRLRDVNGNYSEVAFDVLDVVVGNAVYKLDAAGSVIFGDTLQNFVSDLSDAEIAAQLGDPLSNPAAALGDATIRIIYDAFRFQRTKSGARTPNVVYKITRETHTSDLGPGEVSEVQHSFTYFDGFEREVQVKVQAEPDPSVGAGTKRWVGTGTRVFNNKGSPVQEYEPFFSDSHAFGVEQHGVSPTIFYDPFQRAVCTLLPNHTYEKVTFDAWTQREWDTNDTVLLSPVSDPDVASYVAPFLASYAHPLDGRPFATWYDELVPDRTNPPDPASSATTAKQRAARQAEAAADTPRVTELDPLGRPFSTLVDNGPDPADKFETLTTTDIRGHVLRVTDARRVLAIENVFDMAARKLRADSADAGLRVELPAADDEPYMAWDALDARVTTESDTLRRPTSVLCERGGVSWLSSRTEYGDPADPTAEANNLVGRIRRVYDEAGLATYGPYDFKGNLLTVDRRLLVNHEAVPDWGAAIPPSLEASGFSSTNEYDALNRIRVNRGPDGAEERVTYDEGGAPKRVTLSLPNHPAQILMDGARYAANGQRLQIRFGNGTTTTYEHDAETHRVETIVSRNSAGQVIQSLRYAYDPVGNIVEVSDDAFEPVFNNNARVDPNCRFTYDPAYRLVRATGREHGSMGPCHHRRHASKQAEFIPLTPQPLQNGQDLYNYTRHYTHDPANNVTEIRHVTHRTGGQGWTRTQEIDAASNKLSRSRAGCTSEATFDFLANTDANGNLTRLPHLEALTWSCANRLLHVETKISTTGVNDEVYFQHDLSGERVRKVLERGGSRVSDRIYLGPFEIHREVDPTSGAALPARISRHVTNGKDRFVTVTYTEAATGPTQIDWRYTLENQIGSSVAELDQNGVVTCYEEYYPFGGTAYLAGSDLTAIQRSRHRRYSGKVRDDETGLYYFGARYYCPWLARWCGPDPMGTADGPNLFQFVSGNPVIVRDRFGFEGHPEEITAADNLSNLAVNVDTTGTSQRYNDAGELIDQTVTIRVTLVEKQAIKDAADEASGTGLECGGVALRGIRGGIKANPDAYEGEKPRFGVDRLVTSRHEARRDEFRKVIGTKPEYVEEVYFQAARSVNSGRAVYAGVHLPNWEDSRGRINEGLTEHFVVITGYEMEVRLDAEGGLQDFSITKLFAVDAHVGRRRQYAFQKEHNGVGAVNTRKTNRGSQMTHIRLWKSQIADIRRSNLSSYRSFRATEKRKEFTDPYPNGRLGYHPKRSLLGRLYLNPVEFWVDYGDNPQPTR